MEGFGISHGLGLGDLARGFRVPTFGIPAAQLVPAQPARAATPAPYYLRLELLDKPGALAKVDVSLAEQKGIFPVGLRDNGKTLVLAMADPSDLSTIDQVAAKSRARVVVMVAGEREIEHAILRHYRGQEPVTSTRFGGPRPQTTSSEFDDQGTDDDFKVAEGNAEYLAGRLQERYGWARDRAVWFCDRCQPPPR